jgi:hypothetical protein
MTNDPVNPVIPSGDSTFNRHLLVADAGLYARGPQARTSYLSTQIQNRNSKIENIGSFPDAPLCVLRNEANLNTILTSKSFM